MITVSTSGFSYDDWIGRFYPPEMKKDGQLEFFSRFFGAVELNYSYYSYPGEKGIAGHLRKAPGMKFALKGHNCFTHKRTFTDKDLDIYRGAMTQLSEAEALIALLLQFPYSFHAKAQNLDYLEKLIRAFEGFPLAIELRHARWKSRQAFDFFKDRNTTLVTTDAPALPNLYRGGWEPVGPFSYIRMHGRNDQKWWEHDEGWQRYDYLYNSQHIAGMADGVKKLSEPESGSAGNIRDVYVFFNNHWQSQGVINAMQLAAELGIELPEQPDEDMLKRLNIESF